jgi:hypothetical protein
MIGDIGGNHYIAYFYLLMKTAGNPNIDKALNFKEVNDYLTAQGGTLPTPQQPKIARLLPILPL